MADRKPLKVLPDGGGDSTGLSEFRTGDTIGVANGGTGLTTVAISNILTGNGASALSAEANLTFNGTTLTVTGAADVSGDFTAGTVNADSDTAASDKAAMGYTTAEGLILTGQGSTNDVSIKNDADETVASIPTGTRRVVFDAGSAYVPWTTTTSAVQNWNMIKIAETQNNEGILATTLDETALNSANTVALMKNIVTNSGGALTGATAFWTNGGDSLVERMRIHSTGHIQTGYGATAPVTMNTDLNALNDAGLTIMQDGHDDEILALKSSDVAHGVTTYTETDTYAFMRKRHGSYGGLLIGAVMDPGETSPLIFDSTGSNPDDTRSTAGKGMAHFDIYKTNGTGRTSVGGTENLVTFADANTTRFIFAADGTGHADVAWTTYSDARLKKNIEPVPYGLDEVLQLEPKVFDKHGGSFSEAGEVVLEDNGKRQIGFLAQDVKALMPELVDEVDDSKSFYSLSDGKLAAVLVRAIQELNAKLEAN